MIPERLRSTIWRPLSPETEAGEDATVEVRFHHDYYQSSQEARLLWNLVLCRILHDRSVDDHVSTSPLGGQSCTDHHDNCILVEFSDYLYHHLVQSWTLLTPGNAPRRRPAEVYDGHIPMVRSTSAFDATEALFNKSIYTHLAK
jgi:hypothetical protein